MAKKSGSGIGRIFRALGWSISGLKAAFLQEAAFRQELLLCIILAPLGFYLGETGLEDMMRNLADASGSDLLESLIWKLCEFAGTADFPDDISGVLFEYQPQTNER